MNNSFLKLIFFQKPSSHVPSSSAAEPVLKLPLVPQLCRTVPGAPEPAKIVPISVDCDALKLQAVQQVLDDADDEDLDLMGSALEKAFGNQENWTDVRE